MSLYKIYNICKLKKRYLLVDYCSYKQIYIIKVNSFYWNGIILHIEIYLYRFMEANFCFNTVPCVDIEMDTLIFIF